MPELNEAEASRATRYDRAYAAVIRDPFLEDLHRRSLGDEYPEGIEVTGSCTRTLLERALAGLRLPENGLLVDLGCGLGGPGRWLARRGGTRILGFDVSQVAVDAATEAAHGYLANGQYEYRRGSFSSTGLPDRSADGVIAIESLGQAPDRAAAVAEVRRILRPGARAAVTGAERATQEFRWTPLLEASGLHIVHRYTDPDRGQRWLAFCALQLQHERELRDSLGDMADEFLDDATKAPSTAWADPGLVGVQFIVERR